MAADPFMEALFTEWEERSADIRHRIEMTVSCRDCDAIVKAPGAGEIVVEDGERVQIMHNGVRVVADGYYGSWMSEIIGRLRGHHEPQEELVFDRILSFMPQDACMIEIGGFWSYYSLWFLHGNSRRRSLVLEPDTDNLEIGKRNAALNGALIEFWQGFAGDRDVPAASFQAERVGAVTIPMVRVSTLVRNWSPGGLDLLHCDTQGSETTILADCSDLLRQRLIRFLIVSTHAELISNDALTHQRCLAMVRENGGRVIVEHDVHESFSGDGLIAAYFGSEPLTWPEMHISRNRYSTSLFRNPLIDLRWARLKIDGLIR